MKTLAREYIIKISTLMNLSTERRIIRSVREKYLMVFEKLNLRWRILPTFPNNGSEERFSSLKTLRETKKNKPEKNEEYQHNKSELNEFESKISIRFLQ